MEKYNFLMSYKNNILHQCNPKILLDMVDMVVSSTMKKGNEKRIESCKKVGGLKKAKGHQRENDFKKQYNPVSLDDPIEYKATSDTILFPENPITHILSEKFQFENITSDTNTYICNRNLYCSNKSGENIQFTLGQIPELQGDANLEWLTNPTHCKSLFDKYLKKSESEKPADILVYKDKETSKWLFFKMDDIIDFIVQFAKWRKLDTGRIKGDFVDDSKNGSSQYITYEYRTTHKSYFLGLNGGKGRKFIELLKKNIPYMEDDITI